jgi:hypothetical protein
MKKEKFSGFSFIIHIFEDKKRKKFIMFEYYLFCKVFDDKIQEYPEGNKW